MERTQQPLDIHFNVAVLTIANRLFPCGYDVSADVPTDPTLDWLNDHIERTGRMVVWSGASEHTIFACAEVNWAFRAWHDWCHWKGQHEFDIPGEIMVAQMQKKHLRQVYPGRPGLSRWQDIIDAEVLGQNQYHAIHGEFPTDQMAFVRQYLTDRELQRLAA